MTELAPKDTDRPFTGWHALACFLAFFGVMFAVNGVFLYNAITSFPGEDTPKSYLQGLNYNQTLAMRAAQAELGWQAEIGIENTKLIFRLSDASDFPLGGYMVNATLRRRATTSDDTILSLTSTAPGIYQADIAELAAGHWETSVAVQDAETSALVFTARKPIIMP